MTDPKAIETQPAGARPRVVIVGGGFGGLNAAQGLAHLPVDVTLIDKSNHNTFTPLLYQVALAVLTGADIAQPIRSILRDQKNVEVLMDEVIAIDVEAKRVSMASGAQISYDYLALAPGSTHSYYGHDEWEPFAPGLKTVEDATEIRRRVLLAFELAEREMVETGAHPLLRFVIIGGGPTGVELAGAISNISKLYMRHDFRHIDPSQARIVLVEGGDRVLPAYPPQLSEAARKMIERLGVTVRVNAMVIDVEKDLVTVRKGDATEKFAARTILWAAGVLGSPVGRTVARETGAPIDKAGRISVEPDCSVPGHPEIFVIGDLASFAHQTGQPLPGVAQPAIQEGHYVAKAIVQRLRGEEPKPFHYFDKGNLAVIGRGAAVADLNWLRLSGFPAWLLWIFIHLLYIVEFQNRLLIFLQWAWFYLTFDRSARLITGKNPLPLDL